MPSHRTRAICRLISFLFMVLASVLATRAQNSPASMQAKFAGKSPVPAVEFSAAHFKETQASKPAMNRKAFVAMSAAVYGFAFLDMHETVSLEPGLYEHDPLARPFTKLSPPAYYMTGAALATGVNFIAWKLGRSRRWHKLWWLPQASSAYGNLYGYGTTRAREQ